MANRTERRQGRGKRILGGLLVVFVLLWCGYWFAANWIARQAAERIATAVSAKGGTLTCTEGGSGGFPLRLDLHCTGGKLDAPANSFAGALAGVTASAYLYAPGYVEASAASPVTFDAPQLGGKVQASWTEATTRVDAGLGGLNTFAATVTAFALDAASESAAMPFSRLALDSGVVATGPAGGEDYRMSGAARNISLIRAGKEVFPPLSAEFSLVAEKFGTSTGFDPVKTLHAWVTKGGSLKIERLGFSEGPVALNATGTLTLAPTGLISGRLTLHIVGMDKLADMAEALKPGSREKAAQIVGGLTAFTKPAADGSDARELELLVSDGAIFAGMFPLPFVLPTVRF